jgi:hypothetical protein
VHERGSPSGALSGIRCLKAVFGATAAGSGPGIFEHRVQRGTKHPETQSRAQTQKRKFLGLNGTSTPVLAHLISRDYASTLSVPLDLPERSAKFP